MEIISPSIHRNIWTRGPYLANGRKYRIVCYGVFTKWGLSDWFEQGACPGGQFDGFSHDSFFMYAFPVKYGCPSQSFPIRVYDVSLRLDGTNVETLGQYYPGAYSLTHRYEFNLTGKGGYFEARVSDDYVDDNMGELYFEVYS